MRRLKQIKLTYREKTGTSYKIIWEESAGGTHVALSGNMTEMLALIADVVADICDEEPDKIARFCDSLEEAAAIMLAKRKALH